MPDREKVINKVKAIVADMQEEVDEWKDYSDSELRGGLTCDCDWWYKTLQTLKDTIALLKAPEPRVMAPEEVVGNIVLGRDVMLWFEFNDSIKELNAKDIEYNDYLCDDDMPTLYEPNLKWRDNGYRDGVIVAEYNDVFRCWTSRPTDAQREAAPWQQ